MQSCSLGCVGVIDSGVGGLTVLKQLQRDFPNCSYVYLADSAYCPYGVRTPQEIQQRVEILIKLLQSYGAQAVVIACNTASVFADAMRSQFDFPIYDVIVPTCNRVASVTQTKRVVLLATNATVSSHAYERQLQKRGVEVVAVPCSSFVPFVEANEVNTAKCSNAVEKALANISSSHVDTVILGCTHFPLLRKKIAPYFNGATIVECCTDFQPPVSCLVEQSPKAVFFTTGLEKQANFASQWFGEVHFLHIDL